MDVVIRRPDVPTASRAPGAALSRVITTGGAAAAAAKQLAQGELDDGSLHHASVGEAEALAVKARTLLTGDLAPLGAAVRKRAEEPARARGQVFLRSGSSTRVT